MERALDRAQSALGEVYDVLAPLAPGTLPQLRAVMIDVGTLRAELRCGATDPVA